MINSPNSERTINALARINFLHSKYIQDGTISNEDLLYTLSVFVAEPPRFARLYEWRAMNEMECCAYGVFWKAVGEAMGISYKGFLRQDTWRDGIEWADDITAWAKRYEADVMKPSPIANKPAEALIPMITYWLPWFAKPFAREVGCWSPSLPPLSMSRRHGSPKWAYILPLSAFTSSRNSEEFFLCVAITDSSVLTRLFVS